MYIQYPHMSLVIHVAHTQFTVCVISNLTVFSDNPPQIINPHIPTNQQIKNPIKRILTPMLTKRPSRLEIHLPVTDQQRLIPIGILDLTTLSIPNFHYFIFP